MRKKAARVRRLVLVLGDQLNSDSAAFDDFEPECDAVWMAEVCEESTHVWTHQARIAIFLAGMRHFRDHLIEKGLNVHYRQLDETSDDSSLASELERSIISLKPEEIIVVEPGEFRVRQSLERVAKEQGVHLTICEDRHFLCTSAQFREYAKGRKQLRMEFFYREMRTRKNILMDEGKPIGGAWNYDSENRASFGKNGPGLLLPSPRTFSPDTTTKGVLKLVSKRFAEHPGRLDSFDWALTPRQAEMALRDFIDKQLVNFGRYQDAMWTGQHYLYHSRISSALNLKLLDPLAVVRAVEDVYRQGDVPLAAAEGFIRQILGWREYVRGIYWLFMPEYLERNALKAQHPLPKFFWTGDTEMNCLKQVITQTLETGYAHHIQRLMVTGLFALLLGVDPRKVHEWYLAVYVDAVEWVELPNVLGMSQYADGGVMASKPYCASGKYIQRMSNYCKACRFDPAKSIGEDACPFTTLYWSFLHRHEAILEANPRTVLQVRNLKRLTKQEIAQIDSQAERFRISLL